MSTPSHNLSFVHSYLPTPPDSSSRISSASQQRYSFAGIPATASDIRNSHANYAARHIKHRRFLRDNLPAAINKPVIRRLARRGGVRRIQMTIYETVRQVIKNRLEQILKHAITICEHTGRKTLTSLDVVYALRLLGNPIYGFGSVVKGENVHSRAAYARERKARNLMAAREYVARLERERLGEEEEEEEDEDEEAGAAEARVRQNAKVDIMERAMRRGVR